MRAWTVLGNVGAILRAFSPMFIVPALVALFRDPADLLIAGRLIPRNALGFLVVTLVTALGGHLLARVGRAGDMRDHEGFYTIALGWLLLPLIGAIPFALWHQLAPIDAVFESMSGFTTTGFSILRDIDALPASLVFYRGWLQWVGGGGIAVLSVAVLARLTQSGARLMRAELPGGSVTRLKPKIAQTAKTLYGVYLVVSLVVFALVFAALAFDSNMPPLEAGYEALLLTLPTVATGGFVPHTTGLAYYGSMWVEYAVVAGMVLGGTSFVLLYFAVHGEPRRLLRDPEFRFFLGLLATLVALVTANLLFADAARGTWDALGAERELSWAAFGAAVRIATFSVVSIATTTGFSTFDFELLPVTSQLLLLGLMFGGACTGSTTGGMKLARALLLLKVVRRETLKLIHPRGSFHVRIGTALVSEETLRGVIAFVFAYVVIFIIGTLVVALHGYDAVTSLSLSAASIGNVGVGLGAVGPAHTLADVPVTLKAWTTFIMWVGRLEIFGALILFFPSTYTK